MKAPRIHLSSASANYQGKPALHDVNLSVAVGERVAILGRSGAGKSTLLHLIYERFSDGTSLVPQDDGLVQTLSVYHNVYMGRLSQHSSAYNLLNLLRPFATPRKAVAKLLEQVELADKMAEPVAQLSGGQRQRTAIARSLYAGGDLLLADEPVSALDEAQSRRVMAVLGQVFPTQVLVFHDVTLALALCDRIIGLADGKVVMDQPAEGLDAAELMSLYGD